MIDEYKTLAGPSTGELKDRGSKFFAYAFPVYSSSDIEQALESVKKQHIKARHHCFAWRIGTDGNQFRANDDGEPSGTAGKPILGQIDKFQLTNVFIVVVRYFGGTLLGASGLINAYRGAAAIALEEGTIIQKLVEDIYDIHFDYAIMSQVMNAIKKLQLNVIKQSFEEEPSISFSVRKSEVDTTLMQLKALIGRLRLEEIEEDTQIEGLKLNFLRQI